MTTASEIALETLHTAATGIFTGALKSCDIASAFDRRLQFDGHFLYRLLPDGSGPATIDLSAYKRVLVIALGKAAGPMLEILLERMKRRQGLRGICASNQLPSKRNWRFRYFESGHPLPNEDSFAAARAALALLRKARKDTIVFFLISGGGSALFELPLDPHVTLEDTIEFNQLLLASGAPINEVNTLRKHFSAVKGGRLAMAAPDATKVSLLLPDVPLRTLDALSSGPTSPDHSTVADVRELLAKYDLAEKLPASIRAFFARADFPESPGNKAMRVTFLPHKMPWPGEQRSPRSMTAAKNIHFGEQGDLIGRGAIYSGRLQLRRVHTGEHGDGQQLGRIGQAVEGGAGCGEHGRPSRGMNRHHAHAERGGGAHGAGDGVGNVVEFEIEKDRVTACREPFYNGGAGGGKELQSHLEPLAVAFETGYEVFGGGGAGNVERDNQPLARLRRSVRLRGTGRSESRLEAFGDGHTEMLTDWRVWLAGVVTAGWWSSKWAESACCCRRWECRRAWRCYWRAGRGRRCCRRSWFSCRRWGRR